MKDLKASRSELVGFSGKRAAIVCKSFCTTFEFLSAKDKLREV